MDLSTPLFHRTLCFLKKRGWRKQKCIPSRPFSIRSPDSMKNGRSAPLEMVEKENGLMRTRPSEISGNSKLPHIGNRRKLRFRKIDSQEINKSGSKKKISPSPGRIRERRTAKEQEEGNYFCFASSRIRRISEAMAAIRCGLGRKPAAPLARRSSTSSWETNPLDSSTFTFGSSSLSL